MAKEKDGLKVKLEKIEDALGGSSVIPPGTKDGLDWHLTEIEKLIREGGGGGGSGNIDDVKVNGISVVEDKTADIKLKTIDNNSIVGNGDISTANPFPSNWRTDSIAHLIADVEADQNAVVGKTYLGEVDVTASEGLFDGNAEFMINIIDIQSGDKVIWCVASSATEAPYHWEATFVGGQISPNGVISFQPKLVSGTNIKTINNQSLLGSGNIDIQGGGGEEATDEEITEVFREYYDIEITGWLLNKSTGQYEELAELPDDVRVSGDTQILQQGTAQVVIAPVGGYTISIQPVSNISGASYLSTYDADNGEATIDLTAPYSNINIDVYLDFIQK